MINYESLGREIIIRGRDKETKKRYETKIDYKPYFYVLNEDGEHTSLFGDSLERVYCENTNELVKKRGNYYKTFEADVLHANRYLIDNYDEIDEEPIRVCHLDIETEDREGFPNPDEADKTILSIAMYDNFTKRYTIIVLGDERKDGHIQTDFCEAKVLYFPSEKELLKAFINYVDTVDPDVLYAWNGENFDYPYIINRMGVLGLRAELLSPIKSINKRHNLPKCRAWLDLMKAYRKLSTQEIESYSLNYISYKEFGEAKVVHEESIGEMWENNTEKFITYNLKDVWLMVKIEERKGITSYFDTVRRLAFCNWDDIFWNSRVIDFYALKKANRLGIVLPTTPRKIIEQKKIQGARVLVPQIGIHSGVAVGDVKSLYPTAILTCNLSPETIIKDDSIPHCEIDGIMFRLDQRGFVPNLVEELWDLRQSFKTKRNGYEYGSDDYNRWDTTQTVCKFLLNSIYGVMLAPHFRLFNREVGAAVTHFGRESNIWIENMIKDRGYECIYGDSVTGDTIIDLHGKFMPIEDAFTHVSFENNGKEYCELRDGLTHTLDKDGNYTVGRVRFIMRHKCDKNIYRVHFSNSTHLDVTEDHSLINSDFEEVKPTEENLKLIHRKRLHSSNDKIDDTELLYTIGVFLGDGNFMLSRGKPSKTTVEICYGNDHYDLSYVNTIKRKNEFSVRINGEIVGILLESFYDEVEKEKKLNYEFVDLFDNKSVAAFISGLFDTDGTATIDGKIRYSTTHYDWAIKVQRLLYRLGIVSSIYRNGKMNEFNGVCTGKYTYFVDVKSKDRFRERVGFRLWRKQERINDRNFKEEDGKDYYVVKPTYIEKIGKTDGYVYDLHVEDCHMFFANDILVHNTDSIAFKLKSPTYKGRVKEGQKMVDVINAAMDDWCEETWGSAQYNRMELEFELIYKKLLNVVKKGGQAGKKRYAGLVYYQDGIDMRDNPELVVKGFNAKRSDSPEMLRNMQKEVLIDILNGKGDSAKRKLVKLRNDIALGKFDAEEIAIPKGMSKPIGEYVKQVPPHVRGARVANVLCGENIVQEKIKYVYVKPRPGSNCKSDVISFTQQFPYDKFKVDYNRMAEKLIDNVYDTIFITMGWNIEELCGQTSLAAYM